MPEAGGSGSAPDGSLLAADESSSPITQVTAVSALNVASDAPPPSAPPPRRGFIAALLRCCGRMPEEGGDASHRPLSRKLYIPPAPHTGPPFIPPLQEGDKGKKTLVLDLDETLVHSSFKPVPNPDYIIPVEIDGKITDVYVLKRPWVDQFMAEVGSRFEVIVFTASLAKYADPLLDLLDRGSCVRWRLFRESCYPYEGNYVKDLTCLGRPLKDVIIVDNSPHSYIFHPFNAVPISNFIDDMSERDLLDLLPLMQSLAEAEDVTTVIAETFLQGVTPIHGK